MSEKKPFEVVMPKLGLIMTEANLMEWHKQDGEWVQKGEPLFSFESDKSAVEIEAPTSGYVNILVSAGTTVAVQTPIALIHTEAIDLSPPPKDPEAKEIESPHSATTAASPHATGAFLGVRATPKARKIARDQGLDLAALTGSGPRSMIVTADLQKVPRPHPVKITPVARNMAIKFGIDLEKVTGTGHGGRITRNDVAAVIATLVRSGPSTASKERKPLPLDGLRGLIAERLSASWNERPQVTLHSEVNACHLVEMRQRNLTPNGEKISLNAYFIAMAARTLAEFPEVNTQLTEDGLVYFKEINIGIAIDTPRGLVVPVLKNVGRLSLLGIHDALDELVERTLTGKALPEEFSGGTFTVTNLGAFGVDSFTPIINPPEATILGIGRIKAKPVAVEGMLGIRDMVILSLSFDHRLIDGAPAARFLQRICQLVEDPERLT
jgi:pyruvate dehydrogenase E2 component (dihydrolipoamide acetyltransferase)